MNRFDENSRKEQAAKINSEIEMHDAKLERQRLEKKYGKVWTTDELQEEFIITGFMAPYANVERKSDNRKGLMSFQHMPRFYFDFKPV
jgi:hypothetical protein